MNYIIDGHNLISKVAGLALDMPDDEQRLVELLVEFCQAGGHRVEVFFDGAPAGQAGGRNHGRVKAHFVSHMQTADEAIKKRLLGLGKSVKNWALVSSDRSVQAAGHALHANVLSSEEFAGKLESKRPGGEEQAKPGEDKPLSEAEVREWEAIFKRKHKRP